MRPCRQQLARRNSRNSSRESRILVENRAVHIARTDDHFDDTGAGVSPSSASIAASPSR